MKPDNESARGLAQVEGYLLWNAEVEEARRRAGRFTEQLPWLTTAQREDVERVYVKDRVDLCRESLTRIADRAVELRGEYTERYERLRARCVAASVLTVGAVSGTCTALTLISR
ncbi:MULTISPECIES: hypothetical protein [unclassified Streptomyces]|uniref:Cytochrome C oxidase subunit I n=2 Tax=Streptomyces TaxID=1883 RepID=A0ABU2RQH9_9ACTN|nr:MULTISPECIES: hypothetical protein [unclassified Streptomyces]MYR66755.1 hypothetical protein [Streptomyces sp. SID4939]MYS03559.1 hypothetical protein [Streptomyces sp. SID4940]MYT65967.1 hypothetical protein [Streptomyces sp. SID8357]MYT85519.1 hypothetical protein [Streptomyces sp. SID8360]MYW41668.1 hypothetical protein [Streptomyces sp. SID1]MYX77512.1 hypothetical protein [Streptomyces sp. SID3915]